MKKYAELRKFNRTKKIKELFSQGLTLEQAIEECKKLGDHNPDCLEFCAKRYYREHSKEIVKA